MYYTSLNWAYNVYAWMKYNSKEDILSYEERNLLNRNVNECTERGQKKK